METSQPLSIESFSYSWLVNLKPSLESLDSSFRASLDASDEASFIEMDPKMPPSKRFFSNSQDFKFDFPISQAPLDCVHADELFSNGYVMPFFVDPLKIEAYDVSDSSSQQLNPASSHTPKAVSGQKLRCSSLRRCRTLSKQMFRKYFRFLKPLYRRIRGQRPSCRSGDMDTNVKVVKTWLYSAETSPRISVAYSVDDCWRRSCDSDSSIYEAVLHCKKSIGK
ncbi:probable membrane-associated kinase regulator 6 [Euphorbia lathyris]|uniref:probable membrane-associated kinase regulator 6 n=1 Tax=Euphorbia lathyris TaxID=212925 RepID=UPI003313D106